MIRLHINIDHIATLRNARGTPYPDPLFAAQLCEQAGADGITCHLREDRRHIRDEDLRRLRAGVGTLLNLEMAVADEMLPIAREVRPDMITLVPERREERTTEGGLDVAAARRGVEATGAMCQELGVKLSLFIEASPEHVRLARELGARQVEFHTGAYAEAADGAERQRHLVAIAEAATLAASLGLEVAAGHGLTRHNLVAIAAIPEVEELNIGHAVISDAVLFGMRDAVQGFRRAVDRGLGRRGGR